MTTRNSRVCKLNRPLASTNSKGKKSVSVWHLQLTHACLAETYAYNVSTNGAEDALMYDFLLFCNYKNSIKWFPRLVVLGKPASMFSGYGHSYLNRVNLIPPKERGLLWVDDLTLWKPGNHSIGSIREEGNRREPDLPPPPRLCERSGCWALGTVSVPYLRSEA